MVLDRFRLGEELGTGAMAAVFRAHDQITGQTVALKALFPHLADHAVVRRRFLREVSAAQRIVHPNVARVYAFHEDEHGIPFAVMELFDGTDLKQRLTVGGRLSSAATLAIAMQMAAGLGAAHERGVIHRDVKPHNVLLSESGDIRIVDFGLAAVEGLAGLTTRSMVLGTPEYLAPEVVLSSFVDARADVYGMGVTLFECLTGTLPFVAGTPYELLRRKTEADAPRPSTLVAGVEARLDEAVWRAMARRPEDRFPSMLAFVQFLDGETELAGGNGAGGGPGAIVASAYCPVCGALWETGVSLCAACGAVEELPEQEGFHLVLDDMSFDEARVATLASRLSQVAAADSGTIRDRLLSRKRSLPALLGGPLSEAAARTYRKNLEDTGARISVRRTEDAVEDLLTRKQELLLVSAFAAFIWVSIGLPYALGLAWMGVPFALIGLPIIGMSRHRLYRWMARRLKPLAQLTRLRGAPPLPKDIRDTYRAICQTIAEGRLRELAARSLRCASALLGQIDRTRLPTPDTAAMRRDVELILAMSLEDVMEADRLSRRLEQNPAAPLFDRLQAVAERIRRETSADRTELFIDESVALQKALDERGEWERSRDERTSRLLQVVSRLDQLRARLSRALAAGGDRERDSAPLAEVSRTLNRLSGELSGAVTGAAYLAEPALAVAAPQEGRS